MVLNYGQAITGTDFLPPHQLSSNGQRGNLHITDVLKQTQWGRLGRDFCLGKVLALDDLLYPYEFVENSGLVEKGTKCTLNKHFKSTPKYQLSDCLLNFLHPIRKLYLNSLCKMFRKELG